MTMAAQVRNLILSAAVVVGSVLSAAADEVLNTYGEVAMDGFDVVAYFTQSAPALGSAKHTVDYKGSTWRFSSAKNAAAFAADPAAFEPQFNGWCAYAVSKGYAAEVDFVKGWSVLDGKLYLNWSEQVSRTFVSQFDRRGPNAQSRWPSVHEGLKDGSIQPSRHAATGVPITHPQTLD